MLTLLFLQSWFLSPLYAHNIIKPPVAPRRPVTTELHGDKRVDDYFWMRDRKDPEVLRYLEAENTFTDATMRPTEGLQKKLYTTMVKRLQETDQTAPSRFGNFVYYTRWVKGKQHPIYCRRAILAKSPEVILLDVNLLAEGHSYFKVRAMEVSDDGNLLAYTFDTTGFRQFKLAIKDLRTGKLLTDTGERITGFAWAADGRHYFYSVEDAVTKRSYQLYRAELGGPSTLVYEEKDPTFMLRRVFRSRSRAFVFVNLVTRNESEVRYLSASDPKGEWKVLVPRRDNHLYLADHRGKEFFIQTNDRGKNYRLVKTPVDNTAEDHWKEVVPHRDQVMIESFSVFANYAVVAEREGGLPRLTVLDLEGGTSHRIAFPESTYDAWEAENAEFDTRSLRYGYTSLVTPDSVYEYDMKTREAKLAKRTTVHGYNPRLYQSDWVFATSSDGTKVPISLVYKKGRKRDGRGPWLLTGYGAYGVSQSAHFSAERLSLLDRGIGFAIAHIRGGGEMGRAWYEDGRLQKKKNTFSDFIAAAEFLIAEKYTSSYQLAIRGVSAGGLLMGAVTNLRPDLFHIVLADVPYVDALNTMLDASIPLTTAEYKEWGDPRRQEDYFYIKSYCPYSNVEKKTYPILLVRTGLNDSQVMYWEPAKWVAKLRALRTDYNLLLLKVNMTSGHSGSAGRYDHLKEDAFQYAFLLTQLGIYD